jgi:hypothetical protein
MNEARMSDLNRISDLSEVYEALDNCVELERALGRLARADTLAGEDWKVSKAQVHGICARVERRLDLDS